MPCYHCGARQADPARGPSPWKRGVFHGHQVLVCPDCQQGHDWEADMDRCPQCGSVRLVRQLGETVCKSCGWSGGGDAAGGDDGAAVAPPAGLADEVADAVARLLRKPPA